MRKLLVIGLLFLACCDKPTVPASETIYVPIPWDLQIGQYYYFTINGDTLAYARLKYVQADSTCEDGWCWVEFGCEEAYCVIRVFHAPEPPGHLDKDRNQRVEFDGRGNE
jgi:hypothetical protein